MKATTPGRLQSVSPRLAFAAEELLLADNRVGQTRVIEIQRARLLAAMVEESAERGAAGVTVAHVVARAGVSRRTFYELFVDRDDCFLAALDDALARVTRRVLETEDAKAGWVERVRTALTAILSFLDDERGAGRLLIVGSLGAGAQALERRRRVLAEIADFVDQGRKQTKTASELPPLTAEGVVGGVLSILHARLLTPEGSWDDRSDTLLSLTGPLMSMIVLPYMGAAAARKQFSRPTPSTTRASTASSGDLLRDLRMRLTYRTVRVLLTVAATPGGSNRQVANAAGIGDQGQISKLLARLQGLGLIENACAGSARGAPNSWVLTDRGLELQGALARQGA